MRPAAESGSGRLSADGRIVAFNSWAANVVPGDTNGVSDVFVRDLESRATDRASLRSDGGQGNAAGDRNGSDTPALAADGRWLAFFSESSNLVPGDTNGIWDVFVRDRGPLTGIGGLSVFPDGEQVEVSGWATFAGQGLATAGDPADDATSLGELGAELTGASVTYRPEQEDLLVSLDLASLPGTAAQRCFSGPVFGCFGEGTGAGAPTVLYRLELVTGGARFEVRALRASATADPPAAAPYIALHRCDPDCAEHARLAGGIGTTGDRVQVSVPLDALGIAEGAAVGTIRAFTAIGEAAPGGQMSLDEVELPDATIPVSSVSLGVAPAGTSEDEVAFDAETALTGGAFSGMIEASSLPAGAHDVWARACLGVVCAAASDLSVLE